MEYSEQQLSLLNTLSSGDISFDELNGDYIKISIYDEDDTYIVSVQSNWTDTGYLKLSPDDNQLLATNDGTPEVTIYYDASDIPYIKPPEILTQNGFQSGTYKFKIQFLNDVLLDINSLENFNLLPNPIVLSDGVIYDNNLTTTGGTSLSVTLPEVPVFPPEIDTSGGGPGSSELLEYTTMGLLQYNVAVDTASDYSIYTQEIDVSSISEFLSSKSITMGLRAKSDDSDFEIMTSMILHDASGIMSYTDYVEQPFLLSDEFELLQITKTNFPVDVTKIQFTIFVNKLDSNIVNEVGTSFDMYGLSINIGEEPIPFTIDGFYNDNFNNSLLIDVDDDGTTDFQNYLSKSKFFRLAQISPSRREVRLSPYPSTNFQFDGTFENYFLQTLEHTNDAYSYDFAFQVYPDTSIAINSYLFDKITSSDNFQTPSIILRLNEALSSDVYTDNDPADNSIVRKLADDIVQEIIFVDAQGTPVGVVGLESDGVIGGGVDTTFLNSTTDTTNTNLQSYQDLIDTASLNTSVNQNINEQLSNKDKNLNIDFSQFSNHVVFGSAEAKITNFKYKTGQIQNKLVELSQSLKISSGSTDDPSQTPSHLRTRRKELFKDIEEIQSEFTPYERFLYYDAQSRTTGSAPSLKDLSFSEPMNFNSSQNNSRIPNYDGFKIVYKHSNEVTSTEFEDTTQIKLFNGKYKVENGPFYNYNDPVYLSFLLKGGEKAGYSLNFENTNATHTLPFPTNAHGGRALVEPQITGSEYRRFVFEASQSYWRPVIDDTDGEGEITAGSSFSTTTEWEILSGSNITGSYPVFDLTDKYPSFGTNGSAYTGVSGSFLPGGDLFPISFTSHSNGALTSSFIADVKVTLQNPTSSLPFSTQFNTSSHAFTQWYSTQSLAAVNYDKQNIHSLKNNVPKFFLNNSNSGSLINFLNMTGEHFDLIRNYIDNYGKFYARSYDDISSMPQNLMPILAENLGWELINPFSSSLADYFGPMTGSGLSSAEIKNQTWRKIINNLINVYKSKGTLNSIRSLANIYGYPPDTLKINEFGGALEEHNPSIITSNISRFLDGDDLGNVSYKMTKKILPTINLMNQKLKLDWYQRDADADCLEFVFKTKKGSNEQILVKSSGSLTQSLWDIKLNTSTNSKSGSLSFRLSTAMSGSNGTSGLATNAVSMSTGEFALRDSGFWNVVLMKETASLNTNVTQSYKMFVGNQNFNRIPNFTAVSMSITSSIANQNFISSSERYTNASGNLVFGENSTGSFAEIRTWKHALTASKIKQHILNKLSVVGNGINSSKNDLIYRFRFSEKQSSGSKNLIFNDSNPDNIRDYTFTSDVDNQHGLFSRKVIDVLQFSVRNFDFNQFNSKKIIVNPERKILRDLKFNKLSDKSVYDFKSTPERLISNQVSIIASPTDVIDDYIINNIPDADISTYFANPQLMYSESYSDLNNFRETLLKGVSVDINKFILAQEKVYNQSIMQGIEQLMPAKVKFTKGVELRPSLLDREKIKVHKPKLNQQQYHSGSLSTTGSLSTKYNNLFYSSSLYDQTGSLTGSFISYYSSSLITTGSLTGSFQTYHSTSLNTTSSLTSSFVNFHSMSLNVTSSLTSSFVNFHSMSLNTTSSLTGSFQNYYSSSLITTSSLTGSFQNYYSSSLITTSSLTGSFQNYYSASLNTTSSLTSSFQNYYSASLNTTSSLTGSFQNYYSASLNTTSSLTSSFQNYYSSSLITTSSLTSSFQTYNSMSLNTTGSLTGSFQTYHSTSISSVSGTLSGSVHFDSSISASIGYVLDKLVYNNTLYHLDENGKDLVKLIPVSAHPQGRFVDSSSLVNDIGYLDKRVLFFQYGNHEHISHSLKAGSLFIENSDRKYIQNLTRDIGTKVFATGSTAFTEFSSKEIGFTHFFTTSSDGTITYPGNHHIYDQNIYGDLNSIYYGGPDYSSDSVVSQNYKLSTCYPGKNADVYFPNNMDIYPSKCAYTIDISGSGAQIVGEIKQY